MGTEIKDFFAELDKQLDKYRELHKNFLCCKAGCSFCCEKGDYPLSQLELEYLMQGYMQLENKTKIKIQENFKNIKPGGKCPFLIDTKCSVYQYRPIVCRVHGLAYLIKDNVVKVPYCVNENKNYSSVYSNGKITVNPIIENLDTPNILKDLNYGEIRNLADWLKTEN